MGVKDFLFRKMMETKMKGVPKEEQEKILKMIEKNPELFEKIALEIKNETDKGRDQMTVAMEVMGRYKDELQKLI